MCDPDGLISGAEFPLDSYVGHEFEIREMGGDDGSCAKSPTKQCRQAFFKVSDNDDQSAKITSDFTVDFIDNKIKAKRQAVDVIKDCKEKNKSDMDKLLECVEAGVAVTLERVNEEIAFQATVRKEIAGNLENYTCADTTMESSKDIDEQVWFKNGLSFPVHIKHDRPASKIHLIDNFIKPEECEAMGLAAEPILHHATVADGKGGSRLSENRKAMQAGISVKWERPNDPIPTLSRRVYDYANHVLGLDIGEAGQEDLMSIQYFGRGLNDTEPDRYTPHCDGECTGGPHKSGTRMATMVMYCDTADLGGHTNFRNSGIHIKPQKYAAVFFSYINPETRIMDTGFTEHSGCPVYEGTKKIVTQWIRLGVSAELPWSDFNTLGIKKSELEEQE